MQGKRLRLNMKNRENNDRLDKNEIFFLYFRAKFFNFLILFSNKIDLKLKII